MESSNFLTSIADPSNITGQPGQDKAHKWQQQAKESKRQPLYNTYQWGCLSRVVDILSNTAQPTMMELLRQGNLSPSEKFTGYVAVRIRDPAPEVGEL